MFEHSWKQQTLGKPHTITYADMLFRNLNDFGWCRIWFQIESCGQPQRVNQRSFRLAFHICKRRKTAMKNEASRPIFVPIPISGRRISPLFLGPIFFLFFFFSSFFFGRCAFRWWCACLWWMVANDVFAFLFLRRTEWYFFGGGVGLENPWSWQTGKWQVTLLKKETSNGHVKRIMTKKQYLTTSESLISKVYHLKWYTFETLTVKHSVRIRICVKAHLASLHLSLSLSVYWPPSVSVSLSLSLWLSPGHFFSVLPSLLSLHRVW